MIFRHLTLLPVILCIGCSTTQLASEKVIDGARHPVIKSAELIEISGLAPSLQGDAILWTHNDGGNSPTLFALDSKAQVVGQIGVAGAKNYDWEDIESFRKGGQSYLMIADTGGNDGKRKTFDLILLQEPKLPPAGEKRTAKPLAVLSFDYEDGAKDCESLAVDPKTDSIFLISKEKSGGALYRLPLSLASKNNLVAKRIGPLKLPTKIDSSTTSLLSGMKQSLLGNQTTAFSISPTNTTAAILTYTQCFVFKKPAAATWGAVMLEAPAERLQLKGLFQPEALCFSKDGKRLHITSEKAPTPLLSLPVP